MMSSERGFVRRILGILDDYDINFEHLPSGIDTVSVVMSNKAVGDRLDEILEAFRQRLQPDSIDVFENMALIATVGHQDALTDRAYRLSFLMRWGRPGSICQDDRPGSRAR